jgi:dipeptidyl aminopeptidase/acylaminoacyl peptidase
MLTIALSMNSCLSAESTDIATPVTPDFSVTESLQISPSQTPLSQCPGGRLAFVKSGENSAEPGIHIICPVTGTSDYLSETAEYASEILNVDISNSGNALLITLWKDTGFDEIIQFDLTKHAQSTIVGQDANEILCCAQWSPDEKFIGYLNSRANANQSDVIKFLEIQNGMVSVMEHPSSEKPAPIAIFEWSHDGKRILYVSTGRVNTDANGMFTGEISCDDFGKCQMSNISPMNHDMGFEPSFSHDSNLIVSVWKERDTPDSLMLTDYTGNLIRNIDIDALAPGLADIRSPVFSSDNKYIAFIATEANKSLENIFILDLENLKLQNMTGNTDNQNSYSRLSW